MRLISTFLHILSLDRKPAADPIAEFIDARIVMDSEGYLTTGEIVDAYEKWCAEAEIPAVGRLPLLRAMIGRGFILRTALVANRPKRVFPEIALRQSPAAAVTRSRP